MKRCPICNSEMIIVDTHIITIKYKVVNDKRGRYGVAEKPNDTNKISSKLVCQNCQHTIDI